MKLGLALWEKRRKVKTSKVAKVSKTSKKSNEQKIGVDDIYRIRSEHTHGSGLRICDYGSDGAAQKLGFFGVAPSVQRANANQAKLEDSAQLAQVIVLVNELREALVEKGLIKGSA